MSPVTAAYVGVAIEFLGAVLLAAGLATRFAAAAMLALAVVVHLNYLALDLNLLQMALLGWFVVRGAGALSLDRAARAAGSPTARCRSPRARCARWRG